MMSFLGLDLSHTMTYYNYHYPEPKTEIVAEKEEPARTEEVIEPPKEYDPVACSCVLYAQQFLDLPKNTNAIDLISNSQPTIGGGILLNYNGVGHIAVIMKFEKDGFLVKESNYKKCEYTTRIIKYDDKAIVGFRE